MTPEPTRITLYVELKEELYEYMKNFLANNSDWNQQKLMDASLSLFLEDNPEKSRSEDYQDLAQETYLQSV